MQQFAILREKNMFHYYIEHLIKLVLTSTIVTKLIHKTLNKIELFRTMINKQSNQSKMLHIQKSRKISCCYTIKQIHNIIYIF